VASATVSIVLGAQQEQSAFNAFQLRDQPASDLNEQILLEIA
jgi:hypothetical protein